MKRISMQITFLFLVALLIVACTSDQEKIDRAVQMTLEAQPVQNTQPTKQTPQETSRARSTPPKSTATLSAPISTNKAESVLPQNTATPTASPVSDTRIEVDAISKPKLAGDLLGTWITDDNNGHMDFFRFNENGDLWQGGKDPFRFRYRVIDEGSIIMYLGSDTEQTVTVSMPDKDTLLLDLAGVVTELTRQPEIENLPDKLIGYWQQNEFNTFAILPNAQFVTENGFAPYEISGNMIVLYDAFPIYVFAIDEQEMIILEEGELSPPIQRMTEVPSSIAEQLIMAKFAGLWTSSEEDDFWMVLEGADRVWTEDGSFESESKDDRSLVLSSTSTPEKSSIEVYMVDNDTLQLRIPAQSADLYLYRQPAIEDLQAKLSNIWLDEDRRMLFFLPNQQLMIDGLKNPYTLQGNTIFIAESGLLTVFSVDEQELVLFDRGKKTSFRSAIKDKTKDVLFPYRSSEKSCGYIDRQGNIIIQAIFERCSNFEDGLAVVSFPGDVGGYIDPAGIFVIGPKRGVFYMFSEGLARVRNYDGLAGYIDRTGKFVIAPQFRNADSFSSGIAEVETESGRFFIDKTGSIVRTLAEDEHYNYSEGLAAIEKTGGCYYINTDGQVEIQTQYTSCSKFIDGLAAVSDASGCSYINTDGQVEIQTPYDHCSEFSDGLAAVYGYSRCGYIDMRGRLEIDLNYYQCYAFVEDRAPVEVVQGHFAYIDKQGKYVFNPANMGEYGFAYKFRDGLASFVVGGQIGYIDRNGTIVYQPETWSDTLMVDPENLSALTPSEYFYTTSRGTEYTVTRYWQQIVGAKIVWSGTILTVDANGRITVNVEASIFGKTQTFQIFLDDVDQAMLSRLRNNNQITFRATIADFDKWGSQQVPKIYADKAVILSIGN
jgi:hypothetical protein